jgi:hypothetical protein
MHAKHIILALILCIVSSFNPVVLQADMPFCDTLEEAIRHPGSNCIIRPASPPPTEEAPVQTVNPSPNPDMMLAGNNAYTDGATASNGQDFGALGGVGFTAHPFINADGTLTCYSATDPNQSITYNASQLSQPGNYGCLGGAYIEVTQNGACLFYGAFQDGTVAAGGLPIACPSDTPESALGGSISSIFTAGSNIATGAAISGAVVWGVYEFTDDDDDESP